MTSTNFAAAAAPRADAGLTIFGIILMVVFVLWIVAKARGPEVRRQVLDEQVRGEYERLIQVHNMNALANGQSYYRVPDDLRFTDQDPAWHLAWINVQRTKQQHKDLQRTILRANGW